MWFCHFVVLRLLLHIHRSFYLPQPLRSYFVQPTPTPLCCSPLAGWVLFCCLYPPLVGRHCTRLLTSTTAWSNRLQRTVGAIVFVPKVTSCTSTHRGVATTSGWLPPGTSHRARCRIRQKVSRLSNRVGLKIKKLQQVHVYYVVSRHDCCNTAFLPLSVPLSPPSSNIYFSFFFNFLFSINCNYTRCFTLLSDAMVCSRTQNCTFVKIKGEMHTHKQANITRIYKHIPVYTHMSIHRNT